MKSHLIAIVAAVLVVGCGESQQSSPPKPPTATAPDISILKAAQDGNIEAVKQAIADGADVNAKNTSGMTPLHRAGWYGHNEIVELLIAKGADVNAKAENGDTPLDHAGRQDG